MTKKRVDIYGTLEYPLEKGLAAFIKDASGLRRTSTVKHYISMPSGVIHIHTQNTHYVLHKPSQAPAGVEVRV